METTRRSLLRQAASGVLAAGGIATPTIIRAAEPITVTYARAAGGVSTVVDEYMAAKRFDLKHGVNLKTISTYVSIPSYYADFTAGTFDVGIGAWDSFWRMYSKGVPIRLLTSVTSGVLINCVTGRNGATSIDGLRGKTLAAIGGSGAFSMFDVMAKKQFKLDMQKDVKFQNVQNPLACMTLVLAGNVDAGLSWEPYVSSTLVKDPALKPIYNVGEAYKKMTGEPLPYFCCAIHVAALRKNPDVGRRLAAAFEQCTSELMSNAHQAFAEVAAGAKLDPNVLDKAFQAGRLEFMGRSMAEESGRRLIRKAFDSFAGAEGLKTPISDTFFI